MGEDKAFEKWWQRNFCDKKGNPLVFIPLYRTALDFKNYCKMAWNASKRTKGKLSNVEKKGD